MLDCGCIRGEHHTIFKKFSCISCKYNILLYVLFDWLLPLRELILRHLTRYSCLPLISAFIIQLPRGEGRGIWFGFLYIQRHNIVRARGYWMIYRGPGFLDVVWFGSSPSPRPSPVSKLEGRYNLLTEGEGRGWGGLGRHKEMSSILADQWRPRPHMSPSGGRGVAGVSSNDYSCAHGAQVNFGDLTPYLTYGMGNELNPYDSEKAWSSMNH